MNGFRVLGLRWWRRNLLRTFLGWRVKHYPLDRSLTTRDQVKGRKGQPHSLVTRNVNGTYDWKKEVRARNTSKREPVREDGPKIGHLRYCAQMEMLRQSKDGARSFKIAVDGLERAAGPYERGHPSYLTCWWD